MFLVNKVIPTSLFLVGITMFVLGILGFTIPKTDDLAFSDPPPSFYSTPSTVTDSFEPKRIRIPELGIDVSVEKSWIIDGKWEISKTTASYLENSGKIGETGNAVFYAHNTKPLFKNLVKSVVGQIIIVSNDKGEEKQFVIKTIRVVDPTEVSILKQGNFHEITLYTCTGFNNSKRFIVKAEPVG